MNLFHLDFFIVFVTYLPRFFEVKLKMLLQCRDFMISLLLLLDLNACAVMAHTADLTQ